MVGENAGTVLRHAMNLFPLFRRRSFFFQIIYVTVVHANNQIKIIKVLCPHRTGAMNQLITTTGSVCTHPAIAIA